MLTFSTVWTLTKSGHFGTTYLPTLSCKHSFWTTPSATSTYVIRLFCISNCSFFFYIQINHHLLKKNPYWQNLWSVNNLSKRPRKLKINFIFETVRHRRSMISSQLHSCRHGLRTPREEIAFTERPKIQSQSQILRYGRSIFCLPHRSNFSDIFDLCLHWVSVVRACR